MKEVKATLGRFSNLEELKQFLLEDNEKPYTVKGYRRKLGNHKIRNAFVEEFSQKVWFFSRGYGIEFVFSEQEKNRLL